MIDPAWLRRIIAYSEADGGDYEPEHLAMLLDDPAEVLPYLMVNGHGFANWPKARAALAKAAASAPKSRTGDLTGNEASLSAHRAELYAVLHESLTASAASPVIVAKPKPAKKTDAIELLDDVLADEDEEEQVRPTTEDLLNLIKRVRFDEARGADSPSMFISGD